MDKGKNPGVELDLLRSQRRRLQTIWCLLNGMLTIQVYFYICAVILHTLFHFNYAYREIRLQDYLCADKLIITLQKPFRGDPTLTLTEDADSAAIIRQVWNTTNSGSSNKIKYDCQFRVQTLEKPPRGIYTVITKLKFRTGVKKNGCLDYIQFTGGNRSPSERICNDISIDGPEGRLIFDQRDRDVTVHIHIEKRPAILEPLELKMVLTAHSECKYTGDLLCNPKESNSCISRHFVRDNITNCMYPCKDEISCFHDVITSEVDTTNVAISAITSLIFTMLGVGFCVWICWKYWNCITVQQRAHEESAANRRTQLDVTAFEIPTAPNSDAISHEHQPQTPKDLPPSYESLFPDR